MGTKESKAQKVKKVKEAVPGKRKGLSIRTRNALTGYAFFAPWIVGFLFLTLFPVIYSIMLSFNRVTITPGHTELTWQGMKYYNEAINVDLSFKPALADAMIFICCSTPVIIVFALIIAMLLNGKYPMRLLFRAIFFLPVIIMSGPVISQLLSKYTTDFSDISPAIFTFLGNMPEVIQKPALFILNNLVLILWFSGVQILLFLAALQKISPDIYEAASIDGAGAWEKFWKITLPYIKPMALVAAIYTVVDLSNYSNSGINGKIQNHMYDTKMPYSFSAAMSWIYFLCIIAILLVVLLLFNGFRRRKRG